MIPNLKIYCNIFSTNGNEKTLLEPIDRRGNIWQYNCPNCKKKIYIEV